MKKSLKIFALGATILPLGLLSACGGQLDFNSSVNVNNAGAYSEVSAEDFTSYVESTTEGQPAVNSNLLNYKLVYSVDMDGTIAKLTGIVQQNQDETTEMAFKVTMSGEGNSANYSLYFPNSDYFYADLDVRYASEASGVNISGKYKFDAQNMDNEMSEIFSIITVREALNIDIVLNLVSQNGIEVSMASRDDKVNYKFVKTNSQGEVELTYYALYENNSLVAMKSESGKNFISIEYYDGGIEYPDFSGYKDFSLMQ